MSELAEKLSLQVSSDWVFLQVIFRDGEGALQVLPQLVGVIPEARLNLVVYHLRQGMSRHHGHMVLWVWHCCCGCGTVAVGVALLLGQCTCVGVNILLSFAQDDFAAAYRLIKDVEPSTPQEYILKAVANTAIGQDNASVST